MTLAWVLVAVVLGVVLLLGVALRVRKLRLDETRRFSKPIERRLVTPPASPYAPSRGFRLLDETGEPVSRPPLERPRLDPERHYVFNELSANVDEVVSSNPRHNDDWFLSRSSHRSTIFLITRRLVVALVIILVAVVVATFYVDHHPSNGGHHATTTTTRPVSTTTTASAARPTDGAPFALFVATHFYVTT